MDALAFFVGIEASKDIEEEEIDEVRLAGLVKPLEIY